MKAIKSIVIGFGVLSAIGITGWIYFPQYNQGKVVEKKITLPLLDPMDIVIPETYFGYVVDSLEVVYKKIKRNEFLATILSNHNISNDDIVKLSERVKGIFDIRKMGVRKPYELICYKDELQTAKAMIYHINAVDYVVFNLEDSIYAKTGSKEVITREMTSSGIIYSSLAGTMGDNGLKPQLTNDLADIFAWEVEFLRLYPGDRFKLIYEENFVDGESIGYGDIKGAVFEHAGKKSYAYFFDQGSGVEYFDEEGNSLRKTFLKYPVKFSRISSRYSGRRYHPVQKRYKSHRGTDFAAPQGTEIRAVGDGVITKAHYEKYNGNNVKIKHNSVYSTQYLHMVKIASGIRPGVKIKRGQIIGFVGHTGLARGNHVCYRFWKYGQQIDAMRVDLPSSDPVREELFTDYKQLAYNLKQTLDKISYPPEEAPVLPGK